MAKKWSPVQVSPQPCSKEQAEEHLGAFADTFILEQRRERWKHVLLQKPEKAFRHLVKFQDDLNIQVCKRIEGTDTWPETLEKQYGATKGVYFNGRQLPVFITAAEASMLGGDAIFSMVPGKLAMFFFHEGWAWVCKKP